MEGTKDEFDKFLKQIGKRKDLLSIIINGNGKQIKSNVKMTLKDYVA